MCVCVSIYVCICLSTDWSIYLWAIYMHIIYIYIYVHNLADFDRSKSFYFLSWSNINNHVVLHKASSPEEVVAYWSNWLGLIDLDTTILQNLEFNPLQFWFLNGSLEGNIYKRQWFLLAQYGDYEFSNESLMGSSTLLRQNQLWHLKYRVQAGLNSSTNHQSYSRSSTGA